MKFTLSRREPIAAPYDAEVERFIDEVSSHPLGGDDVVESHPAEAGPCGWLADRYDIVGEIGSGGMATVYRAIEIRTGRQVAIKVVGGRQLPDAEAMRRFELEARTVSVLSHPNIVETLAVERGSDSLAIVSAYVAGRTLRDELDMSLPFSVTRALRVLRDVTSALAHAHAHRIVHRDVKPSNVIVETVSGRALLTDFGIARTLDDDTLLTLAGSAIGTPAYMAPEQIAGDPVDERADVYALGLLGWEMFAGRRPWEGATLYTVLHNQQHEDLPDLAEVRPDIPVFVLTAIRAALAKDPAARPRDAGELEALLRAPAIGVLPAMTDWMADAVPADATVRVNIPVASEGDSPRASESSAAHVSELADAGRYERALGADADAPAAEHVATAPLVNTAAAARGGRRNGRRAAALAIAASVLLAIAAAATGKPAQRTVARTDAALDSMLAEVAARARSVATHTTPLRVAGVTGHATSRVPLVRHGGTRRRFARARRRR